MKKRMTEKNVSKKKAAEKSKKIKPMTRHFATRDMAMFTIEEVNRVNTIFDDEKPFE